ncbi:MAG: DUF4286 family protein [Ginsengibacter sp.]
MLIYNITVRIDNNIQDEWLRWQKEVHIPDMMSTGLFYDHRFFRLPEHDDADGKTFIIQFYLKEKKLYEKFIKKIFGNIYKKKYE